MKTFILAKVGGLASPVGSWSDKHSLSPSSIGRIARILIELPSKVWSRFEMQEWLNLESSINRPSGRFSSGFPAILHSFVLKISSRDCILTE